MQVQSADQNKSVEMHEPIAPNGTTVLQPLVLPENPCSGSPPSPTTTTTITADAGTAAASVDSVIPAGSNPPSKPNSPEDIETQIQFRADPVLSPVTALSDFNIAGQAPFSRPVWEAAPDVCSWLTLIRVFAAMGIIFGDIGTSPLYTMSEVFCNPTCGTPGEDEIKGVLSMVLWSLFLIVTVKYVLILLSNVHHGEGGILTLLTMTQSSAVKTIPPWVSRTLTGCAALGTSALIAEGAITPALSVLSAVGGLSDKRISGKNSEAVSNGLQGITIGLLVLLYIVQAFGSSKVGALNAPGCFLYFISIAAVGLYNMATFGAGDILDAWSPHWAIKIWVTGRYSGLSAFKIFASVVLSVTGAEAIYADVGHFGVAPVRLAWLIFVFPALVLNYTGQAVYLLRHPGSASTIFYASIPDKVYVPVALISLFATLVASQAMITGCFSLVSQAINMNLLPPVHVRNTDPSLRGQVYVAVANWALAIMTIVMVLGFKDPHSLANAYGITVLLAFNMSSILFIAYLHYVVLPHWYLVAIIAVFSPICFVEWTYLAASLYGKLATGGFISLLVAGVLCFNMVIWAFGRNLVDKELSRQRRLQPRRSVLRRLTASPGKSELVTERHLSQTDRTCVFVIPAEADTHLLPCLASLYIALAGSPPKTSVLLQIDRVIDVPHVQAEHRASIFSHSRAHSVFTVKLAFGYADTITPEELLKEIDLALEVVGCGTSSRENPESLWFVLSRNVILPRADQFFLRSFLVQYFSVLELLSPSESDLIRIAGRNVVQLGSCLHL